MPSETIGRTIAVATGVCVVCSVLVSTASVCLKERQDANKTLEKRRNVLMAAGLLKEGQRGADVDQLFSQIDSMWKRSSIRSGRSLQTTSATIYCRCRLGQLGI